MFVWITFDLLWIMGNYKLSKMKKLQKGITTKEVFNHRNSRLFGHIYESLPFSHVSFFVAFREINNRRTTNPIIKFGCIKTRRSLFGLKKSDLGRNPKSCFLKSWFFSLFNWDVYAFNLKLGLNFTKYPGRWRHQYYEVLKILQPWSFHSKSEHYSWRNFKNLLKVVKNVKNLLHVKI